MSLEKKMSNKDCFNGYYLLIILFPWLDVCTCLDDNAVVYLSCKISSCWSFIAQLDISTKKEGILKSKTLLSRTRSLQSL